MSAPRTERVAARNRTFLERSVFLWQLLLSAGVLVLVIVLIILDGELAEVPLFFFGVTIVFATTMAAAVVPWQSLPWYWTMALPLIDIVAIILLRQGQPNLGASLFLVFPVIWLATYYRFAGAVIGPGLASVLIWIAAFVGPAGISIADVPRLLVLPIVLVFVSTATFIGTQKTRAQRTLLRQQAVLLEGAFDRAKQQERTIDEVLNAVTFGVVAFDQRGRMTILNRVHRQWLREFGTPDSDFVPRVIYKEDGSVAFDEEERPYHRLLSGENFDDVVIWYGEPGEARMALAVTGRQLTGTGGKGEGSVLVTRNITAELEAIQARDDLVVSVSHELRTPLTSILGYLELVVDNDDLDPQTRNHVDVALKNADRLLALVSDLLMASHDDQVGFLLNFASCDVAAIAKQSVQALKLVAEERKISLLLTSIGSPVISADEFRLRQVIDNLLSNAVKYNRPGGRVSVAVIGDADEVEIFVSDTGRGMSDEEQKHLFQRFYRAQSVRNSTIYGTGLGLSISREIARAHGGDIRVSTSDSSGTTMVITLPRSLGTDTDDEETRVTHDDA